MCVTCKLL
uniref:Uncharacterized protein n=1 Tax=Anguilla anguilla TaxID=7936 RepID=A0A0E9X9M9_ANGAN